MTNVIGTREATELLGLTSPSTIARWVQMGRLTPVGRLPGATGAYLFDRAEIERLAADAETGGGVSLADTRTDKFDRAVADAHTTIDLTPNDQIDTLLRTIARMHPDAVIVAARALAEIRG